VRHRGPEDINTEEDLYVDEYYLPFAWSYGQQEIILVAIVRPSHVTKTTFDRNVLGIASAMGMCGLAVEGWRNGQWQMHQHVE
jgi:hypothetical protein